MDPICGTFYALKPKSETERQRLKERKTEKRKQRAKGRRRLREREGEGEGETDRERYLFSETQKQINFGGSKEVFSASPAALQGMKILEANAGALTNYEVVDFLRSKGAANDSTRVLAQVSPSEYKVYDYLVQTAACNQTREHINDFIDKCKIYGLAKAEVLNIINIRPTSIIDIYTIIEEGETRFGDEMRFGEVSKELTQLVEKTLPPPPTDPESEAGINEGKEETENEEHNVETKVEEQTKAGNDDGREETVVGELMDTS